MGVRIIEGDGIAALYDSTAGYAFGPIAEGDDAAHRLELFQGWVERVEGVDIRRLSHEHIMWLWSASEAAAQKAVERRRTGDWTESELARAWNPHRQ